MSIYTIRLQEVFLKTRHKHKLFCIFSALVLIFIIANLYSEQAYNYISGNTENNKVSSLDKQYAAITSGESSDLVEKLSHKFWNHTFTIMNNNGLDFNNNKMEAVIHYNGKSEQNLKTSSKYGLLSKANISEETFKEFKQKHDSLLNELPPEISESTYKPNSSGIIYVGGGKYSWLSYISLLGLRETGSKLPVEIMLPTINDYEKELEFCDVLLPKLNASCVVIPSVLGSSVLLFWSNKFRSYQFKALALMTTSFQNVLLLDSDNIVIENPDTFFESKLFKEYGMITWPDYWERTISPLFYNISGVKVNERRRIRYSRLPLQVSLEDNLTEKESKEVPYHDLEGTVPDLSTESGQLFINKATNGRTLLLSLYYNIYGPNLYYKLFSLGEKGEGDKDTFAAAATVLNETFYQLKSSIKAIGHFDSDVHFQGKAMAQKNPVVDYEIFQDTVLNTLDNNKKALEKPLNEKITERKQIIEKYFNSNNNNPIFAMHCHYPKLDPSDLMKRKDIYDKERMQLHYRMYNNFTFKRMGQDEQIDFELRQWQNMHKSLCEDNLYFEHFNNTNRKELCEFINNQVRWLSQGTKLL